MRIIGWSLAQRFRGPEVGVKMEFTEEDIAHSLVSEQRKGELLETYHDLKRRNELIKQAMDSFKSELASIGIGRRLATRPRTVHDPVTLDPALWSGLPVEILHVVFSHLPLPLISQLRVLSKAWDQFITGQTPGFSKVCAKVSPKVFGMLSARYDFAERGLIMGVRAYDTRSNKWHRFRITRYNMDSMGAFIHTMCAGDGGLVCIVSSAKDRLDTRLSITVFNPLTRKFRALPALPQDGSLRVSVFQPLMVQLAMVRESKCYKVIVSVLGPIVEIERVEHGRVIMGASIIYSSETGEWSNPMAHQDLMFGFGNSWVYRPAICGEDGQKTQYISLERRGPCVFDCANGKLIELDDRSSPCKGVGNDRYALVKDRLFLLREKMTPIYGLTRFSITEHRAQMSQPYWVEVREHLCKAVQDDLGVNFEDSPTVNYHMRLHACKDFLLVTASNAENGAFKHELAWLYDMSTYAGKWLAISPVLEGTCEDAVMFELNWDAVP